MRTKTITALVVSAALSFGVAACGDDNEKSAGDSAKPVAQVDTLTGVDTAVKLDAGFVDALTSLKVAPGPVGDAEITKDGSAVFPITGGNVTYYEPGTVSPTSRASSTTRAPASA